MKFKNIYYFPKKLQEYRRNLSIALVALLLLSLTSPAQAQLFGPTIELDTLNANHGFVLQGKNANHQLGSGLSSIGDINGDGIEDILISAPGADVGGLEFTGECYVLFGQMSFPDTIDLTALDGSNGFTIEGKNVNDLIGVSVGGGGDFNGDGIADLVIGTDRTRINQGDCYVVFGQTNFPSSLNLRTLNGSNGFAIEGSGLFGQSSGNAGDVNDDGFDDLIVGAYNQSVAGEAYIVFGKPTFPANRNIRDLQNPDGFVIKGMHSGDRFGQVVSNAGDVNGDGIDDVIIGAPSTTLGFNRYAGSSYVIFGKASFADTLKVDSLNGSNGFIVQGIDGFDNLGTSVSYAGDINGDSFDDVIIGVPETVETRKAYVIFGKSNFPAIINADTIRGKTGFPIFDNRLANLTGISVSHAGDINNDNLDDIIIGSILFPLNNDAPRVEGYVVFGRQNFADSLNLANLNGENGFAIRGIDTSH
jgi:hypothetical protein